MLRRARRFTNGLTFGFWHPGVAGAKQSPEAIRSAFPTLTLEQVYGATTFYLGHRAEVDEDLAAREREENAFSETNSALADVKAKPGLTGQRC